MSRISHLNADSKNTKGCLFCIEKATNVENTFEWTSTFSFPHCIISRKSDFEYEYLGICEDGLINTKKQQSKISWRSPFKVDIPL
jgi:hypothetical protein